MIYIEEGFPGAHKAVKDGAYAIVVDALRASATLCSLAAGNASEIYVCGSAGHARRVAETLENPVLVGEENARMPDGFDFGNSPLEIDSADVSGRTVVFTSTNGARMLVACKGAKDVAAGGVINSTAVANMAHEYITQGVNVVIIPAGDHGALSEEDMASATLLAEVISPDIEPSRENLLHQWKTRIAESGLLELFRSSRHGIELCRQGLKDDIGHCSTSDVYAVVPQVDRYESIAGAIVAVLCKR
jgi:2-phosphosulfolactate phosphatase